MTDSTAITISETKLAQLEDRVRRGLGAFVEVGNALREIRDRNGFRLRGYKDFNAYCEATFGFTERNGYRLIAAAETAKKVEQVLGEAPRNEAAARELSKVAHDPKLIERVKEKLARAKKTVATATAEQIKEVVDKVRPATQPMFDGAKAKEKEPSLPPLSDACPGCGQTPASYLHTDDGWHCGACQAQVFVGVIPARPAVCGACGQAVAATSGFCPNCGMAVE